MATKYLGARFDIHGGGMDLMFPHHENELAQSESATGQTFVKYWMHNGLTRMKTKASGGEWKVDKISGTDIAQGLQEGAAVDARALIEAHGADLIRYLILSTHYRRPIEFNDEVISSAKKGLSVFSRLLERLSRITGAPLADDAPDMDRFASTILEGEYGAFARAILNFKMKFLEMMDDDFNTAGAIAVLHESASEINSFIERHAIEQKKQPELVSAISAAVQSLRKLGLVLGLFRPGLARPEPRNTGLVDQLMQLIIELRAAARQKKDFATADAIREGLAKLKITLEDRTEGTGWRKD
jgi:cysteinyl-tRNA synthetase